MKNLSLAITLTFLTFFSYPVDSTLSKQVNSSSHDTTGLTFPTYQKKLYYTLQLASCPTEQVARNVYNTLLPDLPIELLPFLRIEKVSSFYTIRTGRSASYKKIVQLSKLAKNITELSIVHAYIKDERIIKLHDHPVKKSSPQTNTTKVTNSFDQVSEIKPSLIATDQKHSKKPYKEITLPQKSDSTQKKEQSLLSTKTTPLPKLTKVQSDPPKKISLEKPSSKEMQTKSTGSVTQLITLLPKLLNEQESIKAAEFRRNEADHRVAASKAGWLPTVNLTADAGLERVNKVTDETTNETRHAATLRVEQLISDFGETKSSINWAQEEFSGKKAELDAVRQEILFKGIIAYLEVIKARDRLRLVKMSEANVEKQVEMEIALVKHGAGLSSDILQARSRLSWLQAMRSDIEREMKTATTIYKTVFNNELNIQRINSFILPEAPKKRIPPSIEEAINLSIDNNPLLIAANHLKMGAEHEISFNRSRFYPKLKLFSQASRFDDDGGSIGQRTETSGGITLNYNFYNGGADSSAVKAAIEKFSAESNVLAEKKKIVEEAVRIAWHSHTTAIQKYEHLKRQVEFSGEFLQLARKERKQGNRSLLDILNGEVDYIFAKTNLVVAEIDLIKHSYEIFYAMGMLSIDIMI